MRRQVRTERTKWCGKHPSGASLANFEAVPGPTQFHVRTHEASLHVRQGGVRTTTDRSTDEHLADCGLSGGSR
eukprot:15438849-Alexandrium_andersonii.AAC.1